MEQEGVALDKNLWVADMTERAIYLESSSLSLHPSQLKVANGV